MNICLRTPLAYKRLLRYCGRWGVRVKPAPPNYHRLAGFSAGPGSWDLISWEGAPTIIGRFNERDSFRYAHLLHELAHAVCSTHPDNTEELTDTMGFEILSLLHLGISLECWEEWMQGYELNEQVGAVHAFCWGNAPPAYRRSLMIEACDQARNDGLFIQGTPTYKIERLR